MKHKFNVSKIFKACGKWLRTRHKTITTISSIASTILVFVIGYQLAQSYAYKKYDNFLEFNKMHDEWYGHMPTQLSENKNTPFEALDGVGKAWVRKYFNLYMQEYYFYKEGMIPKEMWENLIHGCEDGKLRAAFCNLNTYPALLQGYCTWRHEIGSFRFPEDFTEVFEEDLQDCGIDLKAICQNIAPL